MSVGVLKSCKRRFSNLCRLIFSLTLPPAFPTSPPSPRLPSFLQGDEVTAWGEMEWLGVQCLHFSVAELVLDIFKSISAFIYSRLQINHFATSGLNISHLPSLIHSAKCLHSDQYHPVIKSEYNTIQYSMSTFPWNSRRRFLTTGLRYKLQCKPSDISPLCLFINFFFLMDL